jgi:UDP:flavonoid glycosyltransferase YjiC (YdhE family)
MASVLYAWEFGANLGHIGTFLPIARELRAHGNAVHWVVTHPHQAARLLPKAGFDWLQAPTMPEQQRRRTAAELCRHTAALWLRGQQQPAGSGRRLARTVAP